MDSRHEYAYRRICAPEEHAEIYRRLRDEDLLWPLFSEIEPDEWSEELYVRMLGPNSMCETWAGYVDGAMAGIAYLWPFDFSHRTRIAEIGLTAFRDYFGQAARLARGCLVEICEAHNRQDRLVASIVGRVPAPNRHILAMLEQLGFSRLCRLPGMFWFTRLQRHVDGWLVQATPESIKATWEVE